jgi:formylglycine-generating enzyme required for sulfatase activity
MHGNVYEWCRDWYQNKMPGGVDPEVTEGAGLRVVRGGSYKSHAVDCRSAYRDALDARAPAWCSNLGFRVAAVKTGEKTKNPPAADRSHGSKPGGEVVMPALGSFDGTQAGQERDDNGLKMKFCWCPAGSFKMGSPPNEPERGKDEDQVEVTLTRGFWLGKYAVTQAEYKEVMSNNPSHYSRSGDRYPEENVYWKEATEFCTRLTDREHQAGRLPSDWEYRLPTEAQREYACRAGTATATAFGDQLGGNFTGRTEVDSPKYRSNAWGLHEMQGNILEWCRDWYVSKLPGGLDPEVTEVGKYRVTRGGSWNFSHYLRSTNYRSASRGYSQPDNPSYCLGFRVAAVKKSEDQARNSPPADSGRESKSSKAEVSHVPDSFDGKQAGQERADNGLKMRLCWCPDGSFTMGRAANEPDASDESDEAPVDLTLSHGFWLGKYAVTQAEYKELMSKNPSYFSAEGEGKEKVRGMDTSRFPVEKVSWEDATNFCVVLTQREHQSGRLPPNWEYRLPTEAQREYACRAGTTTATAFGDKLTSREANFKGEYPYNSYDSRDRDVYLERPTEVDCDKYRSNAWGFHQMHGNVFEWCRDWYVSRLPGGLDPEVTLETGYRATRGGCWNSVGSDCRSAYRRSGGYGGSGGKEQGFRVAAVQFR